MSPSTQTRTERDSLGEREIPAEAYYGIQTARAIENFPVSGWKPYPSFVTATIQVKKAAARVNFTLGALEPRLAHAIEAAADEVLNGQLRHQFMVGRFPAGTGRSDKMNAKAVLAQPGIGSMGG